MAFPSREYERTVPVESSSVVLPIWHITGATYAQCMSFGKRLREARELKDLTQEEVGRGLGTDGKDVSKSVVYGWEKGQHHPRVDQLMLICERLGQDAEWLLFGRRTTARISEESAQLAQEIDEFEGEERRHIIRLCKETIQFVRRRNGGAAAGNDQSVIKVR